MVNNPCLLENLVLIRKWPCGQAKQFNQSIQSIQFNPVSCRKPRSVCEGFKTSFKTRQSKRNVPRIFEIRQIPVCHCVVLYGKISSIPFIPVHIYSVCYIHALDIELIEAIMNFRAK